MRQSLTHPALRRLLPQASLSQRLSPWNRLAPRLRFT